MARKKKEEPVEEIIQEEVIAEEIPAEEVEVEKGRWVETVGPHGKYMIFVKDE